MHLGEEVLKQYANDLKDLCVIEKAPSVDGKTMSMIVAPLPKKKS